MSQTIGRAIGASETLVAPDATRPEQPRWPAMPPDPAPGPRHHTDREAAERLLPARGPRQVPALVPELVLPNGLQADHEGLVPDHGRQPGAVPRRAVRLCLQPSELDGPDAHARDVSRRSPACTSTARSRQNLKAGRRNRFMWWTGVPVPFSPLQGRPASPRSATSRRCSTPAARWRSAPEGSIHVHEGDLLPFEEGAAYLALRAGVPIVPVAITGISAAFFRGRIQVRLGERIDVEGRAIEAQHRPLLGGRLARDQGDGRRRSRPCRRQAGFEGWLTDLFNDWGQGGRAAAERLRGPDPSDVPIPPPAPIVAASSAPSSDTRVSTSPAARCRPPPLPEDDVRRASVWHTRPR